MAGQSANLSFNYVSTTITASDDPWLNLVQKDVKEPASFTNFQMVRDMISYAQSGLSTTFYQMDDCPVTVTDGVVSFATEFYVYPFLPELFYNLKSDTGVIATGVRISEYKETSVVVNFSRTVEFPFLLSDDTTIEWETEAYTKFGATTTRPAHIIVNNKIVLSKEVFGVIRVRTLPFGFTHNVVVELSKYIETKEELEAEAAFIDNTTLNELIKDSVLSMWFDDTDTEQPVTQSVINKTGYSLTNFKNSIIASYSHEGRDYTSSLVLAVQSCVDSALTSCDDATLKRDTRNVRGVANITDLSKKYVTVIKISMCTGQQVGVARRERI